MRDVATYSRWKPALGAAPRLLFGLIAFTGAFVLGRFMILPDVQKYHEGYGAFLLCLMPISIGILFFSMGMQRLLAAFERDCWLRAGPERIAWRLPGKARWKTLWCLYDVDEDSISWKNIRELQLLQYRINGIAAGADLVIVATNGWRKRLDSAYFQEPAAHIREAIAQAAGR